MESPRTPQSAPAPAPRGLIRSRSRSPSSSPTTPSPMRGKTQPPSAPSRRSRLVFTNFRATRNLLVAFEEEALLQQEANEFHAEQDGEEQHVPKLMIEPPLYPISYSDLCAEWYDEEESNESLTEEDGEEQHVPK